MAKYELEAEQERDRWKKDMSASEIESLEKDEDLESDVDERFHTEPSKASKSADDVWAYVDDGFDEEIESYKRNQDGTVKDDHLDDICNALSSWRIALNDNNVLDDFLGKSQDVPTATAYGELMRLIDEYDKNDVRTPWMADKKNITCSLKKLKGTATKLNEIMLKTAAECYVDIDEQTTYRDLSEIALDPVGFKQRKIMRKHNKRTFERLNTYEDEIRGEKNIKDIVSMFLPQGMEDKWTKEEKEYCENFIKDYSVKDEEKRRPYLNDITQKMLDFSVSVEMMTEEYMASNPEKMRQFLMQLDYFEDIRNDPVNAPFFHRLEEKDKRKLDIIDKVATSFTAGDFTKNMSAVRKEPRWYKPDRNDEKRIEKVMGENSYDAMVSNVMYDTKLSIKRLKNERM